MYQYDDPSVSATLPTPAAAGTAGYFTNGNPASGQAATLLTADYMNMVMLELLNIVTAGGVTPSKTSYNQVLSAIKRIGQSTVVLADTGTANAYAATNAVPLVAGTWVDGVVQQVKIAHANTGASTYSPDGLTVIPVYGLALQPLQGGELAVGGTAILLHSTIAGVNSGNPICVLMECAGGAQQIPPATASEHAMQLGQATGRLLNIQTFNSSGTYTPTAGTTHCRVTLIGGGGSGGGAAATSSGQVAYAGGGGGGGTMIIYVPVATVSGLLVTVGAGGAPASSSGATGGASSIGSVAAAYGGGGGAVGAAASPPAISAGGTGGTASTTVGQIFGGLGGPGGVGLGIAVSNAYSGIGGSSTQTGGTSGIPSNTSVGNSGSGPGCGGAGAASQNGGAAKASGAGANGIVVIEEFA